MDKKKIYSVGVIALLSGVLFWAYKKFGFFESEEKPKSKKKRPAA